MTAANELNPCPNPHCGYKSDLVCIQNMDGTHFIQCPVCKLQGPLMGNIAGAWEMWNKIPRTPTLVALIEAARKYYDIIQKLHYGRMPSEVQLAHDELSATLAAYSQESPPTKEQG